MTNTRRRTSVLALIATSALVLAACGTATDDPTPETPPGDETAVPEAGLPEGGGPLGDPGSHIGEEVSATGQVGEVYSTTAFEFIGDAGQGSIMVVADADATWTMVAQGDLVRVTGTIQDGFDATTVDGTEDAHDGLAAWEGNAYLEAATVEIHVT